jgi:L-threonylcarbamoyladenylate synthase
VPLLAFASDPDALERAALQAATVWRTGGLVAFPTETVYGLGADAANTAAVERIFAAKGRPRSHPLIVHIADIADIEGWVAAFPEPAERLAAALWPGPLTLVLPRGPRVSLAVTGGQPTVAIRVPRHPVALALLRRFGGGVAAPSANRFGRVSPTRADHVARDFAEIEELLIIDGGPCAVGVESTIVDLSGPTPRVLRLGGVPVERIAAVLDTPPEVLQAPLAAPTPRVPGTLQRHYAPDTPTRLVRAGDPLPPSAAVLAMRPLPATHRGPWRRLPDNPEGAATALYAMLRELDAAGAPVLMLEMVPDGPDWAVVADRLRRAAVPASADAVHDEEEA